MNSSVQVWVSIAGVDVRAGRLHAHVGRGAESASFRYDESYLSDPRAYALDPALPLVTGGLHTGPGRAQFGVFTDTAPDRWGRMLLAQAERREAAVEDREPRAVSEFGYLVGVRDDLRQGALRLRRDDGPFLAPVEMGVPPLAELPELLDLADRVQDDDVGREELLRLVRAGSSLGGARPKTHVREVGGRVAIAKFPSSDRDSWDVMAWEKVALDLAATAGVEVAPSRLLRVAGRHVLVVDRFDRDDQQRRIGYRSAMTVLELQDGDTGSYLDIADAIERTSRRAGHELGQLWRRMAFTVLISNTDDHLRNHGFLHDGGEAWRLSPAFDVNPDPAPGPTHLRTSIDEARTLASVELLLEVAAWFRLDEAAAHRVLGEVSAATQGWREAARRVGLDEAAIQTMTPAFEHEAARVAADLAAG